jgi:Ser/Thr protein kinase RdoA (MazF antagonist)
MEQKIKTRFSEQILQEAMFAYGIDINQVLPGDGFESFIYEFSRGEQKYILRIGHSSRRSEDLIRGEVDWINFLHAGGAGVSRAILAQDGQLVTAVDDGSGEFFLVTAFEKAPGGPPASEHLGEEFYRNYGRLLGRMHRLTRSYQPADPAWKRPEWDDPSMLDVLEWLPREQTSVRQRYSQLLDQLNQLPKLNESYGLVHFDAHLGNLFVDQGGKITLFDFDDCNYSWFANDIAIVLFYITLGKDNQGSFTRHFLTHFLHGYHSENQFGEQWLREIPPFLKLREIDLYAVIHRSFDVQNIDHPWVAMFMEGRRERIENQVPVIDFDFLSLG